MHVCIAKTETAKLCMVCMLLIPSMYIDIMQFTDIEDIVSVITKISL